MSKTAIIIGAGPAGLTAAYELLAKTDIKPVVIEKTNDLGGISKTVHFKGNRIDIGGHRFFSKSELVMRWWQNILPFQEIQEGKKEKISCNADPDKIDDIMLIRNRLSRIFFIRKFFDYPIALNGTTIKNLGLKRIIKIGYGYLWVKVFPVKDKKTLEGFFISRFGKELYHTFFKDYTEKVWGVSCRNIAADWGTQRVKELSVTKAILHAFKSNFKKVGDIEQKGIETSLIDHFLYPKYGPGQMWEKVATIIEEQGGTIIKNSEVIKIDVSANRLTDLTYYDHASKSAKNIKGDYFFSSMPVKDLIRGLEDHVPASVRLVSDGLLYRDFITVGLLLNKLKIKNETNIPTVNNLVPDNWIYIQERDVKVGRLQIFNNWSPYMIADPDKVWIGLEYFCNEGDELWKKSDTDFIQFAIDELQSIDIINKTDVIDSTIIRMPKTYPAYFGTYNQFNQIREFTDTLENLFLIGRNGMHKYNNQDHSMLTAITAVNNINLGITSKDNIWEINAEEEYHEKK